MSWAIWITGPSGSATSVIARAAATELSATGERVQILELDALRRALAPPPTSEAADRETVYRALVVIARALTAAGVPVIIDATAPRRAWRDLARASIGAFAEVELEGSPDVARERARPRSGGQHPATIHDLAGRPREARPRVDVAYEPAVAPELEMALAPDLRLFTDVLDEATAASEVLGVIDRLERTATERRRSCA